MSQSNDHDRENVRAFADIGLDDIEEVGGKNASLGEMVSNLADAGVRVPDGFATTADAFRRFIGDTGLAEEISGKLRDLDTDDTRALTEVGKAIRESVVGQEFPEDLEADIREAFEKPRRRTRRRLVRRTLQRHGRGPPRRVVRGAAGDVPEHHRHRRRAAGDP